MDFIHTSQNAADFRVRCKKINQQWIQSGVAHKTAWKDKAGNDQKIPQYFEGEWVRQHWKWFVGASGSVELNRKQCFFKTQQKDYSHVLRKGHDTF